MSNQELAGGGGSMAKQAASYRAVSNHWATAERRGPLQGPWRKGDPYFSTYIAASGHLTVSRGHGDCLGWTRVLSATVATYRVGDRTLALFHITP